MSNFSFTIQQHPIFGTHGDFAAGVGINQIRAKYLLTKICPGNGGSWENHLASQMAPWREVFQVEELSFDELIQRDLDDSRVAHDLIPYLLGEAGQNARFFPPILAVLVPRKDQGSGIAARYPESTSDGMKEVFGDLFTFERIIIEKQVSPLGLISYNAQKTAMVIVDGQHRAMAVLALHRQLNKSWQSDPYAPFYNHIEVNSQAVAHIELPVCVIYFPDIHEGNTELKDAGIDLVSVCREIFTVVNKSAKPVGKSRELLLNDDDLAASMMRRTLSKLKHRTNSIQSSGRIFSFAFGDEDGGSGGQAMSGRLEYSSAVAIYKMHGAVGFSMPAAFGFTQVSDVTDGRLVRNSSRPVDILMGEELTENLNTIGRRTAKNHIPAIAESIVSKIGDITDEIMLPLFDELRPFVAHNQAMRELLEALNDPAARADLIQSKCKSLLFEGSGVRSVFEAHTDRLKERKQDLTDSGDIIPPHLDQQIIYCDSVARALEKHEDSLKINRAFKLFSIDASGFKSREKDEVEKDTKEVRTLARTIFDTVATQAFQIGYLMAVLTASDRISPVGTSYTQRAAGVKFLSKLFLSGFNSLFVTDATRHRTLTGYIVQSRAKVFDGSSEGFRGLLQAGNIRELNERQWEYFRWVVLEVVHSKRAFEKVNEVLTSQEWASQAAVYKTILPGLLGGIETVRAKYIASAVKASISSPEFHTKCVQAEADARAGGKSEADAKALVAEMASEKRQEVEILCMKHLKASLGTVESKGDILSRFSVSAAAESSSQAESTVQNDAPAVEYSLSIDELLNKNSSAISQPDSSSEAED